MNKFSLDSKYFENISIVADISNAYRSRKFTIIVNNSFKIELPEVAAASLSSSITQLLRADQTATELSISVKNKYNISESLKKIRNVLVSRETVDLEEEDISVFAEFGLRIGNDEFLQPLNEKLEKTDNSLSSDNVLDILTLKCKFGNSNLEKEISFISSNFEEMSKLEAFVIFAANVENINIIESILLNNNLRLNNEDSLLTFLVSVCRCSNNNAALFSLFENVYAEYCSPECCSLFLNYVNEVVNNQGIRSLISCIGRRFVQSNIPISPSFIKDRHSIPQKSQKLQKSQKPHAVISNEDPLNGILMREYKKGNALMEPSSVENNNYLIDNLFDENKNTCFASKNIPNQYLKASLKDNKTFVLNSYTIRGCALYKDLQIQDWKLEGERCSDGKWIILDQHNGEPSKNHK